jgi:hypothetical protein
VDKAGDVIDELTVRLSIIAGKIGYLAQPATKYRYIYRTPSTNANRATDLSANMAEAFEYGVRQALK